MKLLEESIVEEVSNMFKILGDPTRIKILDCLSKHSMCGCDLAEALNTSESVISHQMRILKMSRLVKAEKQGRHVYYTLDDQHVNDLLKITLEHIHEGGNNNGK